MRARSWQAEPPSGAEKSFPDTHCEALRKAAQAGEAACPGRDPDEALADWEATHRARIGMILRKKGFAE